MAVPLIAWLMLGGIAVAAASKKAPTKSPPLHRPGVLQRPGAGYGVSTGNLLVRTFGEPTGEDFPAPYRFQDAKEIADIVLKAASETSQFHRVHYDAVAGRMRQINASKLPPWRKTFAVILTVVVPTYANLTLWHWYRPRSPPKEARFNAVIAWAALFFALPVTATASATIDPQVPGSSLLPGMEAYLNPETPLKGQLSAVEMRRALYDIYEFMVEWPVRNQPAYGGMVEKLHDLAVVRLDDLDAVYPLSDRTDWVIEGNLKTVDELVWFSNARVTQSIAVSFDESAAWAGLVVQVVAALVSAVAPLVSPALGAAIASAAYAIQAIARASTSGEINVAQVQALGGAGVAFMLDQAAIRLNLPDEMGQIEELLANR